MICDALDRRIASLTKSTSRFGEQHDSLADAITFGVAPGLMVVTLVRRELTGWDDPPFGYDRFAQMVWLIATVYVCCAALRLARFNVEASSQEAAHTGFRGLPSPGASGDTRGRATSAGASCARRPRRQKRKNTPSASRDARPSQDARPGTTWSVWATCVP